MRDRILAERWRHVERPGDRTWLTTGDVAKVLELTAEGVRHLVRSQVLDCELTVKGQRLFRLVDVRRVVVQRAEARIAGLVAIQPRMAKATIEPRQLALDFSARLKLVGSRGKGRKVA